MIERVMGSSVERREIETSVSGELSLLIVCNRDEAGTLDQETEYPGHLSQVVFSYNDALEKTKKFSFDLIILDMDLPEGDWFSTIAKFRELLGNIHIITMIENNSREIEQQAREQKVIYHIVKPVNSNEISSVIHHISKKRSGRI